MYDLMDELIDMTKALYNFYDDKHIASNLARSKTGSKFNVALSLSVKEHNVWSIVMLSWI